VAETWFGVRCVFLHLEPNRTYEERVTIWRACDFDEAITSAEADAEDYSQTLGCEYLGLAQAYELPDPPEHGAEVFSLMRDSALDPEAYLARHFETGSERQQTAER
jgi:hypothetical protein